MNSPDIKSLDALATRVSALPRDGRRRLVAVAGVPASGKSTLAHALVARLEAEGRAARTIPMDGFHLDNRLLDAAGLRARKGAPETFDADGFATLVRRIKSGDRVVFPVFDRSRDLSIAGADVIEPECDIAVFEGNYLLFDEAPWRDLAPLWDVSVWLDTPMDVTAARLVQRWLDHGHSADAARSRAEGNDLPNARRINGARLAADVIVSDPG